METPTAFLYQMHEYNFYRVKLFSSPSLLISFPLMPPVLCFQRFYIWHVICSINNKNEKRSEQDEKENEKS